MTGRGAQGQHPRVSTARKAQLGTGRRQRPGRGGGAVLLLAVAVLTARCGRGGVPERTAPRASCRRAPDGQSGAHLARLRLHWPPCPDGRQLVLPGALRCLALRGGGARALRSAKGPAAQTPVAADRARGAPRRSALAPEGCVSPFSAAPGESCRPAARRRGSCGQHDAVEAPAASATERAGGGRLHPGKSARPRACCSGGGVCCGSAIDTVRVESETGLVYS